MSRSVRRGLVAALAAGLLVAVPGLGRTADDKPAAGEPKKGPQAPQRVAGVIVKVEPDKKGASEGSTTDRLAKDGNQPARLVRLTIKTDAVWRDFVRDQAQIRPEGSVKKAAEKGQTSIATEGQPAGSGSMAVVDVGPDTRIQVRFRSSTDETNAGSATPAAAAAKEEEGKTKGSGSGSNSRPETLKASELKPGHWVEVEYRHERTQNLASSVIVLRPVGGPQTPEKDEIHKTKK